MVLYLQQFNPVIFFFFSPGPHLSSKVRCTCSVYIWPYLLFSGCSWQVTSQHVEEQPLHFASSIYWGYCHLLPPSLSRHRDKWDLGRKLLRGAKCSRQETGTMGSGSFCPWGEGAVSPLSYLERRGAQWCEDRGIWWQTCIIRVNYLHWKISKLFSNVMNKEASN